MRAERHFARLRIGSARMVVDAQMAQFGAHEVGGQTFLIRAERATSGVSGAALRLTTEDLIYDPYIVVTDDLLALRDTLKVALRRADQLLQGVEAQTDRPIVDLPRTQAIEAILRESGQVMRPVEIWAKLREAGRNDPKMEVQVTTFDLWQRDRIAKLARGQYKFKVDEEHAMSEYQGDIASLERMIEDIRRIRDRTCEPKSNSNPRYHALSSAVSQLNRALDDMRAEG